MKVGIIHFGPVTAGSQYIIKALVSSSKRNNMSLRGIKWNPFSNNVDVIEVTEDTILSTFPTEKVNHLTVQKSSFDFEAIVVLGGSEEEISTIKVNRNSRIIEVPISILNNTPGSNISLGHDTALNVIVTNIFKIKDTIGSLLYGKLRVFCVQIPGKTYNPLLVNAAYAVGGTLVHEPTEQFWQQLAQELKDKYDRGINHSILIVNETINPKTIQENLSDKIEVDFKWDIIDESQCVGPYPTAMDRILAMKLSEHIIHWLTSDIQSNRLLINNQEVQFEVK